MAFVEAINGLLVWLTLIAGIAFALFIILMISSLFFRNDLFVFLKKFLKKKGMLVVFVVSLVATLGSLFYSDIMGLNPCRLCWYQRIFMYPLVIVSGVALFRKSKEYAYAIIPLAVIGGLIAAYHYAVQFLPMIVSCTIDGTDCAVKEILSFGYITIPMMALTAFVAITAVSLMMIFSKRK